MVQRMNDFFNKDIISIQDLDKDQLEIIYSETDKIIELEPSKRREIARARL